MEEDGILLSGWHVSEYYFSVRSKVSQLMVSVNYIRSGTVYGKWHKLMNGMEIWRSVGLWRICQSCHYSYINMESQSSQASWRTDQQQPVPATHEEVNSKISVIWRTQNRKKRMAWIVQWHLSIKPYEIWQSRMWTTGLMPFLM